MRTRAGVMLGGAVVVVLGVAAVALNPSLLKSAEQRCTEAIGERRFPDAVTECTRAFEAVETGKVAASLAMAYSSLNRLDEAWEWANRPEAKDQVRALRVRGFVMLRRGSIDQARSMLEEALRLALARNEPGEAARAAHSLAGIHWDAGRYTAAYDAIEISELQARRANDGAALALAELARADIFGRLGDSHRADASFRRAIEATTQWPRDQGYAVLKLGTSYLNGGSPRRAEELFQRARSLAETTGDTALLKAARFRLIDVLIDLGRQEEAAAEFASMSEGIKDSHDWSWAWLRARLALGRNDPEGALSALDGISPVPSNENSRLMLLRLRAEALVRSGRALEAEAAWSEAIRIVEVLTMKEPEQQGWMIARRREPFDDFFVHLVRQENHALAWEIVSRYARAEALSLGAGEIPSDPRSLLAAAESKRARWRPDSEPLETIDLEPTNSLDVLVLHEAGDRLWAGTRRWDGVRFVEVGPSSEFDPLLHAFTGNPDEADAADKLGTAIWRAAGLSPSHLPLLVRTTGRLNRLAIGALRANGRYWIELRPLARMPAVMTGDTEAARFLGAPLIAGDPGGDLAAAREEVKWVARYLSQTPLEGSGVTRNAILSARDRSLMHVATHAEIGLDGARLVVADGEVTTHDILEMRPNARLVVLASCASGTGREAAGSDSLATAFLRAGSGAVLATLRSVPDTATQKLIRAFYESGGIKDPIGALARAQRSLIGVEPTEVWSSFAISLGPSYTLQRQRTIEVQSQ